jgi:hypothetical protein
MIIKPTPEETRRTTLFIICGLTLVGIVVAVALLWWSMPVNASSPGIGITNRETFSTNTEHDGYTFPQVCRVIMPEDLDRTDGN